MKYIFKYKFSIITAACILYISLIKPPSVVNPLLKIENIDKLIHAIMYASLSFIMAKESTSEKFFLKTTIIFFISSIFGGVIEILQSYYPPRTASWGDFIADTIGSALPLVILTLVYLFSYERQRKSGTNCSKPHRRNRDSQN